MAILDFLDIADAIQHILTGQHDFTDATRDLAVSQVRTLVEDRVFVGRKPQALKGGFILLSVTDVEREYLLDGEDLCAVSTVEVDVYAPQRKLMQKTWEGVRQALSSMQGSVTTKEGTMFIGGCTLESEGEPPPDEPIDGSDVFTYFYQAFFRITHQIKSASGVT